MRSRNQNISFLSQEGDGRQIVLQKIRDLNASGSHALTGSLTVVSAPAGKQYMLRVVGSDGSDRFEILDRVTNQKISLSASASRTWFGINTDKPTGRLDVVTTANDSTDAIKFRAPGASLIFLPQAGAGNFNPLTSLNDSILIFTSASAVDSGAMIIGPWSSTTKGLKISGSGRVGVNINPLNSTTFNSYFTVNAVSPTGSVAHFITGLGTNPVTIGRTSNTGSEVLSVAVDDSSATFLMLQDEGQANIMFTLGTGSTAPGGPVTSEVMRMVLNINGPKVGINVAPTTDTLEVNGDIKAVGGYRMVLDHAIRLNAAANTKTQMSGADVVTAGGVHLYQFVAPYAGSIIGMGAIEKVATTSTQPVTFSASINSVANATAKFAVAANKASGSTTFTKDAVTFAAGDRLGVFIATQTGHNTAADYKCWLMVEM